MLTIQHKGIQAGLNINPATITAYLEGDAGAATALGALVGGKVATLGADGFIKLCDGNTDAKVGFIINDVIAPGFENTPALASGLAPVVFGNTVVVTDQIDTTNPFVPGGLVYAGNATDGLGLVTSDATDGGVGSKVGPIGIAGNAATASEPNLTVYAL